MRKKPDKNGKISINPLRDLKDLPRYPANKIVKKEDKKMPLVSRPTMSQRIDKLEEVGIKIQKNNEETKKMNEEAKQNISEISRQMDKIIKEQEELDERISKFESNFELNVLIEREERKLFKEKLLEEMNGIEEKLSVYMCPISVQPLTDPVTASDGHCYNRAHLLEWLEHKPYSPFDDKHIIERELIQENPIIRNQVFTLQQKKKELEERIKKIEQIF
eukprot:TRINITY_DN32372_c0_g1_i1.p1 TRINITY_DN32372_c0_g1~~TRINITY_DN32372_c0_g1_i1.p1  ORF type:complete len:219 (-),score=54.89 TRINITY_DN32372_c0_g1_i1:169-825(-)